ncbi:ABC transporter ATP-binding protein [Streptomyces sp. NBS 14/10]|uniref:ABC transporter ATP-binding protein n=1 Tax=Streptomyces sp. NBS 14/10 TaxID=1945643 RepID=UPI000B9CE71D|nr:ABC transporter ATP-binding protein [Streptomyces sp. NBS 14/10]KAK1177246.1 ABC transporter ATP-binding protein [Streptomyces sp. NBS 14/10]NUS82219.1 ABC transporter ATP-binding protein [Streptomyces sp.]
MSSDAQRHPDPAAPGGQGLRTVLALAFAADRRRATTALCMFVCQPLLKVVTVYLLGLVVDAADKGSLGGVFRYALASAAVSVLVALSTRLSLHVSASLVENTSRHLDQRLQRLAHGIPGIEHYETTGYLQRMEMLRTERRRLTDGLDAVGLGVGNLLRSVATAVLLALVSPWLLLLPLLAVVSVAAGHRSERLQQRALAASAADRRRASDILSLATDPDGAMELRLFGLAPRLLALHHESVEASGKALDRAALRGLGYTATGWLIFSAGYVAGLALVLNQYQSGSITLGQVVVVLVLVTTVNLQVALMVRYTTIVLRTANAGRTLRWLEDFAREATRRHGSAPAPTGSAGDILLDSVSFTYPLSDTRVLRDVTTSLPAGAVVALVGDNGSGKSTLLKLLAGFYRPTSGRMLAGGTDLSTVDPARWRRHMTAVFQDFARLEFTLREAVGAGDLSQAGDDEAILAALESVAATDLVERLPAGLDTSLGRSFLDGQELSGGQWQKIALARAFLRPEPRLVLLDEPTAAIDAVAEHELLDRYLGVARRLARVSGTTTVIVTHRLSMLRDADLVLVLDHGRIVERGGHEELLAQDGLYAEMFHRQANAYG